MTRPRRPRSPWSRVSGALLAAGLAGSAPWWASCQTPTSATVVITTNVRCEIPTPAPSVSFVAASPDELVGGEDLGASATKECTGRGEVGQVVLLPAAEADGALAFRVVMGVGRATDTCGAVTPEFADPWERCIVARRRLGFVDGEAIEIAVPLLEDCLGVECSETASSFTTCVGKGACVAADVDPNDCLEKSCDDDDLGPSSTVASSSASSVSSVSSVSSGDGGAGSTSSSSGAGGDGGSSASSGGGEGGSGDGGSGGAGGSGGGGACDPPCTAGEACVDGECEAVDCNDGARSGDETDSDCGGAFCPPCDNDRLCGDPVTGAPEPESCESRFCDQVSGERRCRACQAGDCGAGTCTAGTCVAPGGGPLPQGAQCTDDSQCQSAHCPREYQVPFGYCCNAACGGECMACETAFTGIATGLCAPTLSTVQPYECNPGSRPCSTSRCDGAGACEMKPEGSECLGGNQCQGMTLVIQECDDEGMCSTDTTGCPDGCLDGACL